MRGFGSTIQLSATDLSQFLACRHLTALNLAVAKGLRAAPTWVDPAIAVLAERGLEHEKLYVSQLRDEGLNIIDLSDLETGEASDSTIEAMRTGADVVIQPALSHGLWFGRPDLLRRNERPSVFGAWSYEVVDTKLAKETRGGTILQLALYSELLSRIQQALPEHCHVVTPDSINPVQTYRVQDYAAYFRFVRDGLSAVSNEDPNSLAAANYPEPVEYCDVCRWRSVCTKRRRDDDHLSLVAGISRLQTRQLESAGINTLAALGQLPIPLPFTPERGSNDTYVRVRDQARIQLQGRLEQRPVHELLPIESGQGLCRLPAPSAGDVFLDLEGDSFAREGGREYLFGYARSDSPHPAYQCRWAFSDHEEKAAFEAMIDYVMQRWSEHPDMHIFHYAAYEPSAFKRLVGRYATRETELDQILRAELFVDLYSVVRHALRASVERYSIKDLEPFYQFSRDVDLADARTNLRIVERVLELNKTDALPADVRAAVEGYNRDDCVSAMALRNWLEQLRSELIVNGADIPRPVLKKGAASENVSQRSERARALAAELLKDLPVNPESRSPDQNAKWLLAHLLEWHWREEKTAWWEYFRLRDLNEQDLLSERAALGGLSFVARVCEGRAPIDRYGYVPQDTDVREGDSLRAIGGASFGKVVSTERAARTIDVKKTMAMTDAHPAAVFAHSVVPTEILANALIRLATEAVANGLAQATKYHAGLQLLLAQPPRLKNEPFAPKAGEPAVEFAARAAPQLDRTVLPIQGPPGAGKTFTGAIMIIALVRAGARVGVTGTSHKVIRVMLDAVVKEAAEQSVAVSCAHKVNEKLDQPTSVDEITSNTDALKAVQERRVHVLGGTQWLWAKPEAESVVDVLFVDEAGQMSLANVLAASQAANSVVLIGDPQQLEQPQKAAHPEGADVSALDHILQGQKTINDDQGIFLPETWRLAPSICSFTSEVFYEGKLHSLPELINQVLTGTAKTDGAGLWLVPVDHAGNQNSSPEEVAVVEELVNGLLKPGTHWIDKHGMARTLAPQDVLVVAPYNAQVSLLSERLGSRGIAVGTVDKFQGQEAPVVIYSMATSTPEDAPRGMEFLYSLNRLNVASSRARCACVIVASPKLLQPDCKSPRQMQLANGLCRYGELATAIRRQTAAVPQ